LHIECAKEEVKRALNDWSRYIDIVFKQEADNSNSDIKFFTAFVRTGGT